VSDAQYASGRSILAIALVTIFIIGAASGWSLVRTLQRAIGADPDYARRVVERIAAGDLAGPVQLQRGDRRSLLSSMAQMRTMLQQMIGRINHGTGSILQASGELVQVGATLSARSAAHAGTLEQTAGSMKELADAVRRNATSAHQADVLAQQASAVAGEGRMQVAALVQRMDALGVASGKIGDIVSLIDGIAFQTNILALNASVEAARAGTLGRGFAVVAGEVRTLAQRAADAAQQIKRLIETSTSEVAASAKLADAAGQTMLRVVSSITQVSTMVGDISSASVEQAIGIEQVNASVATMDATTHHNASMAEQVATAAATMQNLAGALAEIVDHFLLPPATGSGQRGADGA
jgi:methyl-accepting chemotaxis protein